jgi:hypothetical protein
MIDLPFSAMAGHRVVFARFAFAFAGFSGNVLRVERIFPERMGRSMKPSEMKPRN